MGSIIDGKAFADRLSESLKSEVESLVAEHQLRPSIAVVLVGDDPASHVYVRNKVRRCKQLGIESIEHRLPSSTSQEELLALIEQMNQDSNINGILVQLPVPEQIDDKAIIDAIAPEKDVDGFHILNAGALSVGQNQMVPCTPLGSLMLLKDQLGNLSGMNAVVIGRSNIVGKPMASLLLQENWKSVV